MGIGRRMFNLEKIEKYVVMVLVLTLLIGLGVLAYKRSRPGPAVEIGRFSVDEKSRAHLDVATEKLRVNINEAGIDELMRLKGIGQVLAQRIIDYRSLHGPFITAPDITRVSGIGPSLYAKIKDEISTE
jgi:competence ComEA-like helix-hairpin-helix protein